MYGLVCLVALSLPAEVPVAEFDVAWPERRVWVGTTFDKLQVRALGAEGRTAKVSGWIQIEGLSTSSVALADGVASLSDVKQTSDTVKLSGQGAQSTVAAPILAGLLAGMPAVVAVALA